jgi:hypothetical protein
MWQLIRRVFGFFRTPWLSPSNIPNSRYVITPELYDVIIGKDIRTARDNLILEIWEDQQTEIRQAVQQTKPSYPVAVRQKSGRHVFGLPDNQKHEPREMRLIKGPYDRVFWVNLIIACDGPDTIKEDEEMVSRNFGKLEHAKNDLDAFLSFYQPMRIGDPTFVYPASVGRSPGYFALTRELDNPNHRLLQDTLSELHDWITINQDDPEFNSIQINVFYAGHGYYDTDADESGIITADGKLSSIDIAAGLLSLPPDDETTPNRHRIDLYLDCCHSGAIARDIMKSIADSQENRVKGDAVIPNIGFGRIFCSCLPDEVCFELPSLQHGIFSYSFLNEYSRKQPAGVKTHNLGLRDVGWYTYSRQHPFLVDFTQDEKTPEDIEDDKHSPKMTVKFPSAKHIEDHLISECYYQTMLSVDTVFEDRDHIDPLDIIILYCENLRSSCMDVEKEIRENPSKRNAYSRDEIRNQEKIWP